jgi:hypothetical protein
MGGTTATFYPVRWIEVFKLWLPEFREEIQRKSRDAIFMPIYQSFLQHVGLSHSKRPPIGSYLDILCQELLMDTPDAEKHDAAEIRDRTRAWFLNHADWAVGELVAVSGSEVVGKLGIGT